MNVEFSQHYTKLWQKLCLHYSEIFTYGIDVSTFRKKTSILSTPELITSVEVTLYDAATHKEAWDRFVRGSMNGTVFHEQQFLAYHPEGKFNFHHLLFFERGNIVAVLPGGFTRGGSAYESPLGASYGSFVVGDISADTALAIVRAFEAYIVTTGIKEVYLTQAPVIYQPKITQNLEFALLYNGYAFQRHYISHAIDLSSGIAPLERFQPTARRHVRKMLREHPEIVIEDVSGEKMVAVLTEFYPIMLENKLKFDTKPTHSLEDLIKLHELLPDLIKLFTCRLSDELIAGFLIFRANSRVALSFYPMMRYAFDEYKPIFLLSDTAMTWAQQNGFSFFDLGVSQDTNDENPMTPKLSLIRFKEKFDSRGLLRSTLWKKYSE